MRVSTGGCALILTGVIVALKLLNLRWKLAGFKMAVSLEPCERFWWFNSGWKLSMSTFILASQPAHQTPTTGATPPSSPLTTLNMKTCTIVHVHYIWNKAYKRLMGDFFVISCFSFNLNNFFYQFLPIVRKPSTDNCTAAFIMFISIFPFSVYKVNFHPLSIWHFTVHV